MAKKKKPSEELRQVADEIQQLADALSTGSYSSAVYPPGEKLEAVSIPGILTPEVMQEMIDRMCGRLDSMEGKKKRKKRGKNG